VIRALSKTIRAMADGTLSTTDGARISNALGIMRACLETQQLEELGRRLDEVEGTPVLDFRPGAAQGRLQ